MKRNNLTRDEIDALWELGYRPYEIYVCNDKPEFCWGQWWPVSSIQGWEIKHVFTRRVWLGCYPHFDEIIGGSYVGICEVFTPQKKGN